MKIAKIADSKRVWGYARSRYEERFDGACDSREEAISEGRDVLGDEPFYVVEGYYPDPAEAMPSVDRILDDVSDYANDNWTRTADDWPMIENGAAIELEEFLVEWARKYCKPNFWIGIGTPERIEPEAK